MTNEIFLQAIRGFCHLEHCGILHRDIRPGNLMVRSNGMLKIIDLGFGKQVETSEDFDKSITLNWWCKPPEEFQDSKYDFQTEIYFVGKLFEQIIQQNNISHFKYAEILHSMCEISPSSRIPTFSAVERAVQSDQFFEIDFSEDELAAYRNFADAINHHVTKIENNAKYVEDHHRIQSQLSETYRGFMLEMFVPDAAVVLRCLLTGTYYYRKQGMVVDVVKDFVRLLKSVTEEKRRVIIGNLQSKLDAIPRYTTPPADDDIPF
jgi:serine/threonine-protein kinase